MAKVEIENSVMVIKMGEVNQTPTYSVAQTGDYIKWGKDNKHPIKLINLYNNHPEHASIVNGKARYLSGTKILSSVQDPRIDLFLSKANRLESWYQLRKKTDKDKVLFGGWAIKIETNLIGTPINFVKLDLGKCRVNEDCTGFWYSDDWTKQSSYLEKVFIPFYKKGLVGDSVYYKRSQNYSVKQYDGVYPNPDYTSVIMDIETDMEISQFFNYLVKNGFSAGHIITFFNGKLTPEEKKDLNARFSEQYQGTANGGKVLLSFTNPDGKGAEVVNITPNGLAEQYDTLNSRNQQKIITGHNVPGVLFKIKRDGSQLGNDRNELDLAHELFINEYAKPEQIDFDTFISEMCEAKTGIKSDFEVEQIQPIGKELDLNNANLINALNARDPNIVSNYIIKKYGLELPVVEIADPTKVQATEGANESLKSLTGRQRGALDTIARKFNKGTLTEQQAILQLLPFGFNENDAKLYLGIESNQLKITASKQKKKLDELILKYSVDIGEDYELVSEAPLDIKLAVGSIDGKPISKKSFIQRIIDTTKELLGIDETKYELTTVYKYGLRPELKGQPLLIDTSHEFCVEMAKATSGQKRLTFEFIDSLENDSDGDNTNAWDYRGGFWGKKNSCRHIWIGETYKRKL